MGSGIETTLFTSVTIKILISTEMPTKQEKGWPCSNSYSSILVNRLSKFSSLISLTYPFTTKQVTEQFIECVTTIHGMPESIIIDCASIFLTSFWREFLKIQVTIFKISTINHPQTYEQKEVSNNCLAAYLWCYVSDHPKQWSCFLPWAQLWYNSTFLSTARVIPYEAFFGLPHPS